MQVSTMKLIIKNFIFTRCRSNEAFIKEKGLRACFFKGLNTTCRHHIRRHYDVYKQKCEAEKITMKDRCVPRPLWRKMQDDVLCGKQRMLDKHIQKLLPVTEFSKPAILAAVAQLIACDDQVRISPLSTTQFK